MLCYSSSFRNIALLYGCYVIHIGYKSYIFTSISDCFLFETDNHLNMDGSEGEDDSRAYFPCPFCYVEIELHTLCSHLQEEHCFDLKNAVLYLFAFDYS